MAEFVFAEHILKNIHEELVLLKRYNYIQPHTYSDILKLLPTDLSKDSKRAPVPPAKNMLAGAMPTPTADAYNLPPPSYQATANNDLGSVEALYDYKGSDPSTDLNFCRGDVIQLKEMVNNDWWKGTLDGRTGIFPRNYVKKIERQSQEKSPNPPPLPPTSACNSSNYSNYSSNYFQPAPTSQPHNVYPPLVQAPSSVPPPPIQSSAYVPSPPQQQMTYAPPPVQQGMATSSSSAPVVAEQHHEEGKLAGFGKKLAGNVANAATWGFGATVGSDIAHSIF